MHEWWNWNTRQAKDLVPVSGLVSSSLTSCTNDSIAKLVKAVVCKTAIICSNQVGVSKCTSGGTVYTPASGAGAYCGCASSNLALCTIYVFSSVGRATAL